MLLDRDYLPGGLVHMRQEELGVMRQRLGESLQEMSTALASDEVYAGDRPHVLKSREFFRDRHAEVVRLMAKRSLEAVQ